MDYEEALTWLRKFDGDPVAVDVAITRLGTVAGQPLPKPGDLTWTHEGILEITELDSPTDRAVDAAAWFCRASRLRLRIRPTGGIPLSPERFKDARWEGSVLVLEIGALEYRLVRLVRPAGDYIVRQPPVFLANGSVA